MKRIIYLLLFGSTFLLQAQSTFFKGKTSIGINTNTGFIFGDLEKHYTVPGFGLSLNQKIGRVFSVALQYNQLNYKGYVSSLEWTEYPGYLGGSAQHKAINDIYSKTKSSQFQLLLGCDFTPQWMKTHRLDFRLLTGAGLGYFNANRNFIDKRETVGGGYIGGSNKNPNYNKRVNEYYIGRHFYLPVGFGLEYKATPSLRIQIQSTYNYLHNDDIDLIGSYYYGENYYYDRFLNINLGLAYVL